MMPAPNHLFPVAILAGGLATRLRPMTDTLPKALIPINGEPFIHHQLRQLHQQGLREIVLCVGHCGDQIEQHVGDGSHFGLHIQYAYEKDKLLGTGGAIKKALPLLGETFFVLYGDAYLSCDYHAMQTAFNHQGKQALMTVYKNENQWDKSNVEYSDGKIIVYDKKTQNVKMRHIDYGLGLFTVNAFESVPPDVPYDLADLYHQLLEQNQLGAFEIEKRFYEIGSFTGIKELERYLQRTTTI